ncbi:MAG: S8 family serine peptidase [Candidatus Omnitrophica bacterium]|nr:S8 family serine peptidase [Candidatus Omnitrophota bacterium]
MYKYKEVIRKIIIVAVISAFFIINEGVSFATEGMYDVLQRDGKLRLIIKFNDFTSGRISYKLAGREQVLDSHLNEYILWKIDQKYNLKKLKRLFTEKELSRTAAGYAREFGNFYIIEIGEDEDGVEEICGALDSLYGVDLVEPDIKVSIASWPLPDVNYIPNDTYVTSDNANWKTGAWGQSYPDMFGLRNIKAFEAWDLFDDPRNDPGNGIVVAVIDTGVDFSHPDISVNKWINPNEIAGNGIDDDENGYIDDMNGWNFVSDNAGPYDGHGHGTHCSGTIAAVTNNSIGVAGIAPNAKIMALKGLSDSGSGYISWLTNCVLYAANNGAHVLSNSWGGSGSSTVLTDAVNYAHSQGCVIIAAAGNNRSDMSGFMPANIPNAIAVAAVDYVDDDAYFTNYGAMVDVSAPGVRIQSTTGGSYASWSGTSMACPHVSGLAALLLSRDPSLSNDDVRQKMKETADDVIYDVNPGMLGLLGTGRIDAYTAVLSTGPTTHSPVLDPIGSKTVSEGEELRFTISATDEDGDALIYSVTDLPGGLEKSGAADFFVQSDTVYQGTRALETGNVGKNQSCSVTKSVDQAVSGNVSYYWKVDSAKNHGILSFYIDGTEQSDISGSAGWQQRSFDISSGAHTLEWRYTRDNADAGGQNAGWIDSINISYGSTDTYDFENGDLPGGFSTGGHGSFYVASGTAYGGNYALKGDPSIVNNEYEYVERAIQAIDGAEISFWWKVSSEYYYDFLEFYIDDARQSRISGQTSWQKKTFALSAGNHTLKWQYIKDYSVTYGEDTGWVDDIVINNGGEESVDFESLDGEPNPLPNGASFNANTRTFTWTPDYSQAGTYPRLRFVVTEDTEAARSDYEDITITVNDANLAPVLDPIGNKTVLETDLLEFTISATDPEGDELVYSASNLPDGALFEPEARRFSWTPEYLQAGVYENIRFEVAEVTSDVTDENTKLLLHSNGTDGSTTFTDSSDSDHTLTANGSAQIDTAEKKFGTASLLLNGTSDYLTAPDSPDWDIFTSNSDDWTIDLWINLANVGRDHTLVSQRSGYYDYWILVLSYNQKLKFMAQDSSLEVFSQSNALSIFDSWHHVAFCKVGTKFAYYLDGQQVSYKEFDHSYNIAAPLTSGANYHPGKGWQDFASGNMDEIRISHSNYFNASPDSGLTDTIPVDTVEYDGTLPSTGLKDSEGITITVLSANDPPVLNPIGDKTVNEDVLLEFTITATDGDGDTLTYSASNLPSGAAFDAPTHTFSWTPSYSKAGAYPDVRFSVADGITTDTENITITINNVNRAPVLSAIGTKSVDEGVLLTFTIAASDEDGDSLTYSASSLPAGATFSAAEKRFSWTPTFIQAGTYLNVHFEITDGSIADSENITITVNDVNAPPSMDPIGDKSIDEGSLLEFTVTASDVDGDALTYYALNLHSGSAFDVDTQAFSWTPGYTDAGVYDDVIFMATDGEEAEGETISITVSDINVKPVIDSLDMTPAATINEGESITIVINSSDLDGDELTYYVQNEPDGSGFIGSDFYWRPGYDQAGEYADVEFTAYDGVEYSDPYTVTITVNNMNDAPVFITGPTLMLSYQAGGQAYDAAIKDGYLYTAHGANGLKVLDINNLDNIYVADAINDYLALEEVDIDGDLAYLIDSGSLVEILDVSVPSMPYREGDIVETLASDAATKDNTAYLACGSQLKLYDITDRDFPEEIEGVDLGEANKIAVSGDYAYAISADEDLKIIDTLTNQTVAAKIFQGAEAHDAKDIAITGNSAFIAKDAYGIICFNTEDKVNPSETGEFYIANTLVKEISSFGGNRLFALGYLPASNKYKLFYIDTTDRASMAEVWSYSFADGLAVNGMHTDGNTVFIADSSGMDMIVSPLEGEYTVEAGSTLKIMIYALDPDADSVTYSMINKPEVDETVFTDNEDGTATFSWTPTEAQIGSYGEIFFIADDSYQAAWSNSLTITVAQNETAIMPPSIDEHAKLLLHSNGTDGSTTFTDLSNSNHTLTTNGSAQVDTAEKKFGTASLLLNGATDYLTAPDSPDWDIFTANSDDWTIDLWINLANVGRDHTLVSQRSGYYDYWILVLGYNQKLKFMAQDSSLEVFSQSNALSIFDSWHHVVLCKVGTKVACYLDGQQVSYKEFDHSFNFVAPLAVGANYHPGKGWQDFASGHMDEIRISHSNYFNASPDSGLSDTIPVERQEYAVE